MKRSPRRCRRGHHAGPRALRPWRQGGFTIIELALGLAMLVVLAAIATPSMGDVMARQRLRSATGMLQAHLALGQGQATRHQRSAHLAFQPGADWCYALSMDAPVDCRGARADGQQVLKVVRAADHPEVLLLQARPFVLTPTRDAPLLDKGSAAFANLRGQRLTLQQGPMGRASVCEPGGGGSRKLALAAACAEGH